MLTRRGVLLGAGATTAVGAVGGGVALVHRFEALPGGARSGSFQSRWMKRRIGWAYAAPARPKAVLVCLHGRGGNHRDTFTSLRIPAIASAVGLPLVVAAVDGGDHSYFHPRADGTDAMSMLLKEFVPLLQHKFGPLPMGVMGWSMGGYGALLAAELAPTTFLASAPASPALWQSSGLTPAGAFDSPVDFKAYDVFTKLAALRHTTVALACGTGDPFYAQARRLAPLLPGPHHVQFGSGGHNSTYWRAAAPAQLRAIAPALGLKAR